MNMIVAHCRNKGIGFQNKIPWYIPDELKYFKIITSAHKNSSIIMGKNTWLSLPKKPLSNRNNIILSNSLNKFDIERYNNTKLFKTKEEILNYINVKQTPYWVIGGETIYKSFINCEELEYIYVTKIEEDYVCDTFFPEIPENFKLITNSNLKNTNNIFYKYEIYRKFRNNAFN